MTFPLWMLSQAKAFMLDAGASGAVQAFVRQQCHGGSAETPPKIER